MHNVLNQSSWFIRISSAHVDLIRNLMIHFTLRQIISDLVQSCHQITLSHFKTHRINCHFYESFHFITIHSTCVVFLVVTAAHTLRKSEIVVDMLAYQKYGFTAPMSRRLNGAQKVLHKISGRTVPFIPPPIDETHAMYDVRSPRYVKNNSKKRCIYCSESIDAVSTSYTK